MMKKACLCIIGLLFLGALCVPVVAETGDGGYWSFSIVDLILAYSDVKINGDLLATDCYQKVRVPNSLDQVEVQFVVVGGPETTLTITKEYINKLREKPPGWEPVLVAGGGILTYDVDAGVQLISPNRDVDIMTHEHLVSRGWYHHGIGRVFFVELSFPLCFGVSALCSDP
ncbi:MAG: hypothetical protein METHP_00304 [Methanoregula sp. SKADARSKE-2]|nr:MAG: hypothetical protein METHP_00304 [Methanoregula sp. SKADARSKE-2]